MNRNLEAIIDDHSKIMADQMVKSAKRAKSEEDIRHECNKLIDQFIAKAGLTVRGQHEYALAGGHIDSKYGSVFIEYKKPTGSGRITENSEASGVKAVVAQLNKRFRDFQSTEHVGSSGILGVGCDGDTILFVWKRGNELNVEQPQHVTPYAVQRLLREISCDAQKLSFTPKNVAVYFGSQGKSAREGVRHIHALIDATESVKAQTFFRQWQILFGEVCGFDIHGKNAKVNRLADHYGVSHSDPAKLLFAIHTYYAIFIKILAAEIVSPFCPDSDSTLKDLISANTSADLQRRLNVLEHGAIWAKVGIRNFLEGDLFSWYLDAWNDDCAGAVRTLIQAFDQFDPTTLTVPNSQSRDLLKQLYQQLFPKSLRHDLGEYYTPDWLAQLVLDELEYDGNPDKRILDPACGSGTFLVMVLNRIRSWFDEHRHECGFGEDEMLRKILKNVIGFDLNPLAVMATRTNYLMAIGELLSRASNVELPIYLCDSILTPSEYGDVFTGSYGKARQIRTSVGNFNIPIEVTQNRTHIGRYTDTLEDCIKNDYTPDEFLCFCKQEAIPTKDARIHKQLFRTLALLHAENRDGVWARIIKNAFAPLFIGKVDYVVGNPPWINWEHLPEGYRNEIKSQWQRYGLFTLSGSEGRLGGGKKDIAILFTFCSVDNYLEENGRLGFLITQSIFKTQGAGEGFRNLRYTLPENRTTWHLNPITVHDLSEMQVFDGAVNRTAVFVCKKTRHPVKFPVDYRKWTGVASIAYDDSLSGVYAKTNRREVAALPVIASKDSSPWLTAPKQALSGIRKLTGVSTYRAYEGVNTGGLNGCFWIRVKKTLRNGELLIENLYNVGKIKVDHVQTVIEPDLVYPLLRGRNVKRWSATTSACIVLAQDPQTRRGIPETIMKLRWPKTYAFLKQFEGDHNKPRRGTLRGRATKAVRTAIEKGAPFYTMFGVGPYSLAQFKVVWGGQVAVELNVSVSRSDERRHPVLNDQTAYLVPIDSEPEADYLAALLNSAPVRLYYKCLAYKHASVNFIRNLAIGKYRPASDLRHDVLSELSHRCHISKEENNEDEVAALEIEIDEVAAKIWGITDSELKSIWAALADK